MRAAKFSIVAIAPSLLNMVLFWVECCQDIKNSCQEILGYYCHALVTCSYVFKYFDPAAVVTWPTAQASRLVGEGGMHIAHGKKHKPFMIEWTWPNDSGFWYQMAYKSNLIHILESWIVCEGIS